MKYAKPRIDLMDDGEEMRWENGEEVHAVGVAVRLSEAQSTHFGSFFLSWMVAQVTRCFYRDLSLMYRSIPTLTMSRALMCLLLVGPLVIYRIITRAALGENIK
ncbi:hypothetical protein PILCRDRAFT_170355 [Piloderma croceum F 1598]|uniref:Uncharacterized protein n=1 Tax=Piloderma croceum (strain F 1598) TaxID=765440 RepID=A0A0C3GKW0_PILCF|nr:hypothetical protein PILCRDRAFT_170355 [Piloderma croceum F 1598]